MSDECTGMLRVFSRGSGDEVDQAWEEVTRDAGVGRCFIWC